MSPNTNDGDLAGRVAPMVTVLRIIVVALAAGVLSFAVVAVVVRLSGAPPQPAPQAQQQAGDGIGILTMMAIGAAPIALVLSRVVPALMVKGARSQIPATADDLTQLGGLYQTKTIVGAALLEGAAFLSIVAFMLEGHRIALGLGVGLAAVILTLLPSASRVADWIREQQRMLGDERRLSR